MPVAVVIRIAVCPFSRPFRCLQYIIALEMAGAFPPFEIILTLFVDLQSHSRTPQIVPLRSSSRTDALVRREGQAGTQCVYTHTRTSPRRSPRSSMGAPNPPGDQPSGALWMTWCPEGSLRPCRQRRALRTRLESAVRRSRLSASPLRRPPAIPQGSRVPPRRRLLDALASPRLPWTAQETPLEAHACLRGAPRASEEPP